MTAPRMQRNGLLLMRMESYPLPVCLGDRGFGILGPLQSASSLVWSAASYKALADAAHETCPYSQHGNIDVAINLIQRSGSDHGGRPSDEVTECKIL
jgi:hypothetical protein